MGNHEEYFGWDLSLRLRFGRQSIDLGLEARIQPRGGGGVEGCFLEIYQEMRLTAVGKES